jgi:hypothetical protein
MRGSMGGAEKKTPTNHPHSVGGGLSKIKEVCETKQITNATDFYSKLDAKEKLPPSTSRTRADGGHEQ